MRNNLLERPPDAYFACHRTQTAGRAGWRREVFPRMDRRCLDNISPNAVGCRWSVRVEIPPCPL